MEVSIDGPWPIFNSWYLKAEPLGEQVANAMALATADAAGRPSVRVVLFRGVIDDGICFYTNYLSRKGQEIESNPNAALCFYWQKLGMQLRVEGVIERLTAKQSEAYFQLRPRGSQIAAWASPQSKPIRSKTELEERVQKVAEQFEKVDVLPCPEFWGGYRLVPKLFEFWREGNDRLHERILYERVQDQWQKALLGP